MQSDQRNTLLQMFTIMIRNIYIIVIEFET